MKPYGSIPAIMAALEAGAGMFMREDVELLVNSWATQHHYALPDERVGFRTVYHVAMDSYTQEKI